jgi:hypothetical protein
MFFVRALPARACSVLVIVISRYHDTVLPVERRALVYEISVT